MSGTVWSKFFWSDWESDPALRLCSFGAQGLWMRMLCIAAAHDPIGYVAVAGRALDETAIARMTGGSESEVRALVGELDRNGVFSRDRTGRIYSRRMVSDARRAALARKNGKQGGNPSLRKDEGNPRPVNPVVNAGLKSQEPEARDQKKEAADAGATEREQLDGLEAALRAAAGASINSASPSLLILAPILGLLRPGQGEPADLEADVLPSIRATAAKSRAGAVRSWSYFVPSITEARDRRLAGAPKAEIIPYDRPDRRPVQSGRETSRAVWAEIAAREAASGTGGGG